MAKSPACLDCNKINVKFGKGKKGLCNRCYKIRWENLNPIKLRAQRLYGNAQKRAKEKGWGPLDFDSVYIYKKIQNGYCEVTGIPFDLKTCEDSIHAKNPWVPSLDRIDSKLPYSKNNIKVVVFMYNVCKSTFTHEDVIYFCKKTIEMENEIGL